MHGARAYENSKLDTAMGYNNAYWRELEHTGKIKTVDGCKTAKEAIHLAGMGWTVSMRPLMTVDGLKIPQDSGLNCYAVVRDDTEAILGTVGKDYMPVQNDAAFEMFDAVTQTGKAKYEVAGTLDGGRRFFILARTNEFEVVPGDRIEQFLLLHSAHDGSGAVKMQFTNRRPQCWNALGGMLSENAYGNVGKAFSARHTTNVLGRVQEARNILQIVQKENEEVEELYVAMSHRYPSEEQIEDVLTQLFPADEESAKSIQLAEKKKNAVLHLFEEGENCQSAPGTAWALYNAATEWQQYSYKAYTPEARLESQWLGPAREQERNTLQVITATLL